MTEPHADPAPPPAVNRLVLAARALLVWERLARAFAPAAAVAAGGLALALSGLLPQWPGWLHAGVLAAAALALALALAAGVREFAWPGAAETLRRLERDNDLLHRPLQTLADRPASGDAFAAEVWRRHREAAARLAAGRVRLYPPRPGWAARDRFGLRFLVGAALLASLAASWGEGGARLAAAFAPRLGGPVTPAVLDLWLTPPAYTGLPPVVWRRDGTSALTVPAGAVVLARVAGGGGAPVLTVNGAEQPFAALDDERHFEARAGVRSGSELTVRQDGRVLGGWSLAVRPETAPTVSFTAPPAATGRGALRLAYRADDDYGVAAVSATLRLEPPPAEASPEPLTLALPVGGADRRHVEGAAVHDLTANAWAGLPVRLRLTATGAGGLTGVSDEVALVLPERAFVHPVARRLVAVRKDLARRGEAARLDGARALGELSVRPEDFAGDAVVFLALRVAVARLGLEGGPEALVSVRELLWQTALRLEEGSPGLARRDLEAAAAALREALDGTAGDEEIRKREAELEAALGRYLESLQNRQAGEPPPPEELERTDLDAMMQSLRDLAETGARDAASQMLSRLTEVLDSLREAEAPPSPAQARLQELARQLEEIARGEQALLERTFHQESDRAAAAPLHPDPGGAAEQEALRQRLGAVLLGLGEEGGAIPKPLVEAERAMHAATAALGAGDGPAALAAEGEAVEKLRDGRRALGRALSARLSGPGGRDPLGRRRAGVGDGASVRLPERPDLQRARQILDELRRRAGEPERPRQELDYIERLLRQF